MSWKPNQFRTATNTSVTLNATSFTDLMGSNNDRLFWAIGNPNDNDVIVNFRAAADAVDDTGLYIPGGTAFEMQNPIYTGAVSAIAVDGAPTVLVIVA